FIPILSFCPIFLWLRLCRAASLRFHWTSPPRPGHANLDPTAPDQSQRNRAFLARFSACFQPFLCVHRTAILQIVRKLRSFSDAFSLHYNSPNCSQNNNNFSAAA